MNIVRILITVALLIATASGEWQDETSATHSSALPPERTQSGLQSYIKSPLIFVPNAGQTDSRVRFVAQSSGANFYFTSTEAVFVLVCFVTAALNKEHASEFRLWLIEEILDVVW